MNENGVYGVGSKPVIFSIPDKKADSRYLQRLSKNPKFVILMFVKG